MLGSASQSALLCITESQVPGARRLLLVRHGRTTWTDTGRYQGRSDLPLAPGARADILALAEQLRGIPILAALTSPLRRAASTAALLTGALGLPPPRVDPRLIELAYGGWEGLTQDEIKAHWPGLLRQWKHNPERVRFPDGEDLAAVATRMLGLLQARPWGTGCGATPGNAAVLLVTHTAPIRLLRLVAEGRPLTEFRRVTVSPASLHTLYLRRNRISPGGLSPLSETYANLGIAD